jgi:hypothetical protein
MKASHRRLSAALAALCLLAACANPRDGALSAKSRSELDQWAESSLDIPQKYLKLAEKTAQLLQEASAQDQDQLAMDMFEKYVSDNDLAIRRITSEFRGWSHYADEDELNDLALQLYSEPYGRRLRELAPAFRQRISYSERWLQTYDAFFDRMAIRR